jgi:predicted HicB family RNase H-like nuclease
VQHVDNAADAAQWLCYISSMNKKEHATESVRIYPSTHRRAKKLAADKGISLAKAIDDATKKV